MMQDDVNAPVGNEPEEPAAVNPAGILFNWQTGVGFILSAIVGTILARLADRPIIDGILVLTSCAAVCVLALRLVPPAVDALRLDALISQPLRELFDSAGPAVVTISLDGRLNFINPAGERMIGYHAEELMSAWTTVEILAPGEGARLLAELARLCGSDAPVPESPADRMAGFMQLIRTLPPSRVPGFDAHLLRKDGTPLPVTLHFSALRNSRGVVTGLVAIAIAIEQPGSNRNDQDQRESQERYRDLFESSSEMIATLSTAGRFLYANPAWKRCFGKDNAALLELNSFDDLFQPSMRNEVAAQFRRALDGEVVDRTPLRHHTHDGRVFDFELSLSQRQNAGNPLAIRCLLRDVTQQKQREHRLALQLVVSQIVGENTSSEAAAMRILEAVCVSQAWDMAVKWVVNADEKRLEFSSAWGAPGRNTETFIQESMGLTLSRGADLPGRAWQDGRSIWVADLDSIPISPRIEAAVQHDMVSGWSVPVRVGSKVLAVLEFYCSFHLQEDREALAAVETVAASVGQMIARSQEQGRAEELSRRQEILLDSVADGICGVDRRGRVSFANPAAARLLGADAASIVGKPVHELLHGFAPPNRHCGDDCPILRAAGRQKSYTGEDTIFRADGNSFPAEYVLTPISHQGRFSGSVLSFRDISQRYALDRLKDEFISTVSHELRTPLTSIRGALGLLSSGILGQVNDKSANLLRIALTNSDRLVRLINDILDLERIQSGKEPLAFRQVQLAQIVRQAIEGMQPVADAAGVQLIHDKTQVEITADPDRLLQVVTNLLSNAIKFSPPDSTVSVMLRPRASGVTLSVIDQGRGIPADKLEAIFGRFQQVDASDSRQKGGSGLGLAICRTIVLQHTGRIWAERNPVRGATFRVLLPYQPVAQDASEHPPEAELARITILVADSNPLSRLQTTTVLARQGYRLLEAATLEDAVAADQKNLQAILLQTSLDGFNGFEALPLLHRLDRESSPVIVLTSVEDHPDAEITARDVAAAVPATLRPTANEAAAATRTPAPVYLHSRDDQFLADLSRMLCEPGEKATFLLVEPDANLASSLARIFAGETVEVHIAHSFQGAMDKFFTFQPDVLLLNIGLNDGDSFNLVDWLRLHNRLDRLPILAYSSRDLSVADFRVPVTPSQIFVRGRIQPGQLEALVNTLLRTAGPVSDSVPPESAVQKH
jgi:PAS domain S-box-containing protein